mmetsp:Transcript_54061/g.135972  ORF Transcript_54061/g.135972 Transcript_54061/m.135972 type:complete len:286 (-) Transcript_54061:629-1486(-)
MAVVDTRVEHSHRDVIVAPVDGPCLRQVHVHRGVPLAPTAAPQTRRHGRAGLQTPLQREVGVVGQHPLTAAVAALLQTQRQVRTQHGDFVVGVSVGECLEELLHAVQRFVSELHEVDLAHTLQPQMVDGRPTTSRRGRRLGPDQRLSRLTLIATSKVAGSGYVVGQQAALHRQSPPATALIRVSTVVVAPPADNDPVGGEELLPVGISVVLQLPHVHHHAQPLAADVCVVQPPPRLLGWPDGRGDELLAMLLACDACTVHALAGMDGVRGEGRARQRGIVGFCLL